MTRDQWLRYLLDAAREDYEMGRCSRTQYERGTMALMVEWQQRRIRRRELAKQRRAERHAEREAV